MAKFVMGSGLETYIKELEKLGDAKKTQEAIKFAVYPGAGIVADAVKGAIKDLPEVEEIPHSYVPEGYKMKGISPTQKQGLLDGLGLSVMRAEDGAIYTKLGFDGYNGVRTKKYPSGQPNALIARAVESGTSFRQKIRFIAPAVKAATAKANAAMASAFDEWIKQNTEF